MALECQKNYGDETTVLETSVKSWSRSGLDCRTQTKGLAEDLEMRPELKLLSLFLISTGLTRGNRQS